MCYSATHMCANPSQDSTVLCNDWLSGSTPSDSFPGPAHRAKRVGERGRWSDDEGCRRWSGHSDWPVRDRAPSRLGVSSRVVLDVRARWVFCGRARDGLKRRRERWRLSATAPYGSRTRFLRRVPALRRGRPARSVPARRFGRGLRPQWSRRRSCRRRVRLCGRTP